MGLFKGFRLTKWNVNFTETIRLSPFSNCFILTMWYVNSASAASLAVFDVILY